MGKSTYRQIKKATPKQIVKLREGLREILINIFNQSDRPDMAKFAETMDNNSLEFCLHIGFSEKAFVQAVSGVIEETPFLVGKSTFHSI